MDNLQIWWTGLVFCQVCLNKIIQHPKTLSIISISPLDDKLCKLNQFSIYSVHQNICCPDECLASGRDSGECVTASGKLRGQKHYLDITPEPSQLAPSQINQKVYLFTRERNKFGITVSCVVKTVRDRAESSLSEHNRESQCSVRPSS